jgi:hypothetical protein
MAVIARSIRSLLDPRDELYFTDRSETSALTVDIRPLETGAVSRFYRFVYPNMAFDRQQQLECLEALVRRNKWLG